MLFRLRKILLDFLQVIKDNYERNYKIAETLCCVVFPVITSVFLVNLPLTSYTQFIILILFFIGGLVWSVSFTSILGKLLFAIGLVIPIIVHTSDRSELLYLNYVILLTVISLRIAILWYVPKRRNWIATWVSRIELLNQRFTPNEVNLFELIEKGDKDSTARAVLAGYHQINTWDEQGRTPLITAVERDMYSTVINLLNLGANPELGGKKIYDELTPLYLAIDRQNTNVIAALLDQGKSSLFESRGTNPLKYAISRGKKNSVRSLINYIEINESNRTSNEGYQKFEVYFPEDNFEFKNHQFNNTPKININEEYVNLLKKNPNFWMDKLKKLFAGDTCIFSQKAGYLLVITKCNYLYQVNKFVRTQVNDIDTMSIPVGVLRAGDQLESNLKVTNHRASEGCYTFPSSSTAIKCDDCQGTGYNQCPAACDTGIVKCKNPDCIKGFVKCDECSGRGEITKECQDCKIGYQNCDLCDGKGFYQCAYCNGNGYLTEKVTESCPCKTQWLKSCPHCQGKGKTDGYVCTVCHGKKVLCSECNNSKQRETEECREVSCHNCQGTGIGEYCDCSDGYVKCKTCGGNAQILENCSTCHSSGSVNCQRCQGDGKERCQRCNGRGVVGCSSCEGTGKLYHITYTELSYSPDFQGDYALYDTIDRQITQKFYDISPQYLDEKYRGISDQYRYISREKLTKIANYTNDDQEIIQELNKFLNEIQSNNGRKLLLETLDMLVIKYDIIEFLDGDCIVLFEEQDPIG
ncbi:ankyrin repeat domain-containing protein [Natranaerobius thermophilus]|uniref:Ankyrin n=1 Tax=Natranaerobius thermophilus (strain ATCC BAA-1301 / DSM 18059 / JW/NM-WN-LF) TaxID=457570 RepID=B2A6G4_NATTJ|nr:ankyrin repeat domain-containing protein [Natranaerobius thermophilus]ACB85497.1 Ankyrin [Natranaerobius thermophilus JW/NM-WN-LF]